MEYLREGKKNRKKGKKGKGKRKKREGEKKDTGTATSRIEILVVEERSDKTETSTQDVIEPFEGWTEPERKVNWVDQIKTIGEMYYICMQHFTNSPFREKGATYYCSHHYGGLWRNCSNVLFQLKLFL